MNPPDTASIVLGGGCFWCTEAAFKLVPGVRAVTPGYAGGDEPEPTYEQVCAHQTGHAEVVKIEFDPRQVSLERLLELFWRIHNPTQADGQGNDLGPQYRSIILCVDDDQMAAAEKSLIEAAKRVQDPITTEIAPLKQFWPAEEYHHDYFARHPDQGYCTYVIAPKLRKLEHALVSGHAP
ncbi:peptide-methionine (S)-S-oxide reductase MsrA [Opitutus sp. ER46]|uniref:peptide-methionine (S)-S-oxide reductase MsrA n=1 Tax=Opitutus sp. ER46 TaxID=2161864 RepID=UPI000D2FEFA2|nr:peptide-methionine (S)-S-oxide reductase MsrA [Opitutus sp. ER46]PTY00082.1 peptide-methionine (S)-S-oxide reductase [Opitutus sp. ER46]